MATDPRAVVLQASHWTALPDGCWQPPESTRRHSLAVATLLVRPIQPGGGREAVCGRETRQTAHSLAGGSDGGTQGIFCRRPKMPGDQRFGECPRGTSCRNRFPTRFTGWGIPVIHHHGAAFRTCVPSPPGRACPGTGLPEPSARNRFVFASRLQDRTRNGCKCPRRAGRCSLAPWDGWPRLKDSLPTPSLFRTAPAV